MQQGCAIAEAVSHWLPTAETRVRASVRPTEICGGQSGAGAGFLRKLRFPLPIFIPPIAPQSPSSKGRDVAAVVDSILTPIKKNKIDRSCYANQCDDELMTLVYAFDRLCGLMVRVPGYGSRDPGFNSRRYEIF
jgi:hypothetical protein